MEISDLSNFDSKSEQRSQNNITIQQASNIDISQDIVFNS